jgi:hypothetical protein
MTSIQTVPPARAKKSLSVFVFYTDFPAGVHAKVASDGLIRLAGASVEPIVNFWKLDSIPEIGPLKQAIIQEARRADLWILACSSPCDPDALILRWMNSLSANNSTGNRPRLLVGLFDRPSSCAANFGWFLDVFSLFAKRASREFVLQPPGCDSLRESSWLHEPFGRLLKTCEPQFETDYLIETISPETDLAVRGGGDDWQYTRKDRQAKFD